MDTEIKMLKREVMGLRAIAAATAGAFRELECQQRFTELLDAELNKLLNDPVWEADAQTIGRETRKLIAAPR